MAGIPILYVYEQGTAAQVEDSRALTRLAEQHGFPVRVLPMEKHVGFAPQQDPALYIHQCCVLHGRQAIGSYIERHPRVGIPLH